MTTQEVANKLIAHCREGQFEKAVTELYSKNIVSFEPEGSNSPRKIEGFDAVMGKTKQFGEMLETVHVMEVSDALVAGEYFSCKFSMDITMKGAPRMTMEEVATYKVQDGKVVWEEFYYSPSLMG